MEMELKAEHAPARIPLAGTLINTIECATCHRRSVSEEPFIDLTLALDDISTPKTVSALLDAFTAPCLLRGDNRYQCVGCGTLCDASRTTCLKSPPPKTLVVTLARFRFNDVTGQSEKVLASVELQEEITLRCSNCTGGGDDTTTDVRYILHAAVMHSGRSVSCGHYYCVARTSGSGGDGTWMMFNDSRVTRMSFSQLAAISHIFPTDVPYILFFSRCGGDEDAVKETAIPEHLRQEVFADNAQLLLELERRASSTTPSSFWGSNSKRNFHGDGNSDDDDDTDTSHGGNSFQQDLPRMVC